jgi:hypothetical protein
MTDDIVIAPDDPGVCIEDFCGGGRFPTSFSADYYPRLKFTRFRIHVAERNTSTQWPSWGADVNGYLMRMREREGTQ